MNKKKIGIIIAAVIIISTAAIYIYKKTDISGLINKSSSESNFEEDFRKQQTVFEDVKPDSTEKDSGDTDYLKDARKINEDVCGWITIEGTEIDFPVVQTKDNDYYLEHDFEKNYTYMGVPYLDYRNNSDFSDFCSVVYGHNISNRYMFAPINNFKNADYFSKHTTGTLTTKDKIYTVNFIACDLIDSRSEMYNVVFIGSEDKKKHIDFIKENAVVIHEDFPENAENEKLLILSTCSYEFDDARTVLIGVIAE